MDCSVCLNLQNDGICTRFGKEPPAGFAARCRHYAPDPDAPTPAEPEPEPEPASSTATCDGTDRTTDRLCRTDPCPYLDAPYCISGVRAEADAPPEDLDALPGDDPGPLAALVARTDADTVAAAVSRLPVHYRDAVLLRYWEELSLEETAVALGVPLGTAKFRLARARALLRAALEPLFGKEPR